MVEGAVFAQAVDDGEGGNEQPESALARAAKDGGCHEEERRRANVKRRPLADRTRIDKLNDIAEGKSVALGGESQPLARRMQQILDAGDYRHSGETEGNQPKENECADEAHPAGAPVVAAIGQVGRCQVGYEPTRLRMARQPGQAQSQAGQRDEAKIQSPPTRRFEDAD